MVRRTIQVLHILRPTGGARTNKELLFISDSPQWKLLKFPDGYTLWLHKSGHESDPANPRTDAYLHGAPHLGSTAGRTLSQPPSPTIFRSPQEFVEHAIWLMRACQGQCLCKYCTPGQNQRDINLRLNRGCPDDDDDDDDGSGSGGGGAANNGTGGGAGGASSSGQPTTASRGRGAGTRARRGRRARRDRSPPIMAKDYRVGNMLEPRHEIQLVTILGLMPT
jgi:hypothetical protein